MNESIYNQTQVRQRRQPERLALFVVFTDMTKEDWIMGRIENHPILGPSPEGKTVTFYYNGTPIGGLFFIVGWLLLVSAAMASTRIRTL